MRWFILTAMTSISGGLVGPAIAAELAAGTYHCIAGGSRTMLTLGDMTVSGQSYTFKDPTGGTSAGRFEPVGDGFRWGDIGAIAASQIVESGLQPAPGGFFFRYKVTPKSLATTVSCRRI